MKCTEMKNARATPACQLSCYYSQICKLLTFLAPSLWFLEHPTVGLQDGAYDCMVQTILKSPLILAVVLQNLVKSLPEKYLISLLSLENSSKFGPSFTPCHFSDKRNDCAIENLFTNF